MVGATGSRDGTEQQGCYKATRTAQNYRHGNKQLVTLVLYKACRTLKSISFGTGQTVRYRAIVTEQGHGWDVLEQYGQLEQDGHTAPEYI